MIDSVDIVIPTCKPEEQIAGLKAEILSMAGMPCRVFATCLDAAAARNRNAGLDWAETAIVLMVDDDICKLPFGWAKRMVQVMEEHPHCQMASPRLMRFDGRFGIMSGLPRNDQRGCEVLPARELCTACVAIRKTILRFDEQYIGSGFEDNDFCRQLAKENEGAEFICIHDLQVVHRNEMKNQGGKFWEANQAYYRKKWGLQ